MLRRDFLKAALAGSALPFGLPGCQHMAPAAETTGPRVMTVNGWLDAVDMGLTLTHEHLAADDRPFVEQASAPVQPDAEDVVHAVLPYLDALRSLGCRTLVDATATRRGRNPALVKRLSDASGLHMLVPTGFQLGVGGAFAPDDASSDGVDALALRWIREWDSGIDDTGIRPGFVKLGVGGGPLSRLEEKAMCAAALAHLETGLTIAVHAGPWRGAEPGDDARSALRQLEFLKGTGVSPSAWIWVHAQNERDTSHHVTVAREGAYLSLDGYRPGREAAYIRMLDTLGNEDLLDRVLVSGSPDWYMLGEPRGDFAAADPILTRLVPAMATAGFPEEDIDTIFRRNPARAFAVRVRRT